MKTDTVLHRAISATAISLVTTIALASPASSSHLSDEAWLRQTLIAREAALSRAYNTCNLHALRASLFESTRIVGSGGHRINPVIEARDRVCGRLQRELVAGSLRVRAVGDHAALVTGVQRFCPLGAEPCLESGVAFARLWVLAQGQWRIGWMCRSAPRTGDSRKGQMAASMSGSPRASH